MERRVLKASEGKMLTNGVFYGRVVYLAKGADLSAWREVSESECFKEGEE